MELGKTAIQYEEEFISNSRGIQLFTCRWIPSHCDPKGLVFLCHGYGMECSISLRGCAIRLAKAGYAVYGMDYEGHGKSSGLQGFIPSFANIVNDCSNHYTSICEVKENERKKRILMGESMGGTVALLLHMKKPEYWDMAVLVAPGCQIADEEKLHPFLINFLNMLIRLFPTCKFPAFPDIVERAFRLPETRDEIRSNPLFYKGWIRLRTGQQVYKVVSELGTRLAEVTLPFLVSHGTDDKVVHPSVSKFLYESASSWDKTFKLYPGMWHSLTYGELPHNMDLVFSDIINWLDARVA